MNRIMSFIVMAVVAVSLVIGFTAGSVFAGTAKNYTCTGKVVGDYNDSTVEYKNVTVPKGESCKLVGVTLSGNVKSVHGSVNVKVVDSTVGRGIHVRKATGLVFIGTKGCGFDPTVGNNVNVQASHDVLICYVHTKNNIMVTGNDGQVTVRDSVAGNNISVSRNKAFVADANDPKHNDVGAIRLLRNVAGNHIHVFGNDSSRDLILRKNTPTPVVK